MLTLHSPLVNVALARKSWCHPLAGRQWWPNHCPSPPPGFQLSSSLLFHSQQEALSAASPILQAAVFLSFPVIPMALSILHTDWAVNPLQPTSTGNSHACHLFPLQSCKRSWYLALFLSKAWSHPSSQGTIRMIFFTSSDHRTASALRAVWMKNMQHTTEIANQLNQSRAFDTVAWSFLWCSVVHGQEANGSDGNSA